MKCQGNPERISAFIDGQLSDQEAESAAAHIDSCPACSKLRDEYLLIGQLFADETPEAPEGFTQAVMQRITGVQAVRKKSHFKRYGALAAACAVVIIAGVSAGVLSGRGKSTGSADSSVMRMADAAPSMSAPQDAAGGAQNDEAYAEESADMEAPMAPATGESQTAGNADTDSSSAKDGGTPPSSDAGEQGFVSEGEGVDTDYGGSLQGVAGLAVPGQAEEAAQAGQFALNVEVSSLEQAQASAQEAGIDYHVFTTETGVDALVLSLADFQAVFEADANVLSSEAGDAPDAQWVLITQN